MQVMIELVGEQPIPNLLPVKYLKPSVLVLVRTDRTKLVAERLRCMLQAQVELVNADPYNIAKLLKQLGDLIETRGWKSDQLLFNITGGTKLMSLAAFHLAARLGSPCVYLQTEGGRSLLHSYRFREGELRQADGGPREIPSTLTLDEYLRAHLGEYKVGSPRNESEHCILCALRPAMDEIMPSVTHGGALEIDLVVRCANQVGIAQVKTGRKASGSIGINQLNTAGEQRYLGTYTHKFLMLDRDLEPNNRKLAEEHCITTIVLETLQSGDLSDPDKERLVRTVRDALGGER